MNSEYILDRMQIEEINRRYGGTIRNDAEIETSLLMGKGKTVFRKVALLWRAVIVGHPFTDGNKRTAAGIALVLIDGSGFEIDKEMEERLGNALLKVAKENLTDLNRIERLVRYAIEGN